MPGWSARRPFVLGGSSLSVGLAVVILVRTDIRLPTDVTLLAGALGRMNFVSWNRPLSCQFRTMGTLCWV